MGTMSQRRRRIAVSWSVCRNTSVVEPALNIVKPIFSAGFGYSLVDGSNGICFAYSLAIRHFKPSSSSCRTNNKSFVAGSIFENLTIGITSITTHTTSGNGSSRAISGGILGQIGFDGFVEIIHATTNGVIRSISHFRGRVVKTQSELKLGTPVIAIDQCLSLVRLRTQSEVRSARCLSLQHVTPIRTGCIVCEGNR